MSICLHARARKPQDTGCVEIPRKEFAQLLKRLHIAEYTVQQQDRMITSLEDDIRKARTAEANQIEQFYRAVGSLR